MYTNLQTGHAPSPTEGASSECAHTTTNGKIMRNHLASRDHLHWVTVHLVGLLLMGMALSSACWCNMLFATTFSPGPRATTTVLALNLASSALERLYCIFASINTILYLNASSWRCCVCVSIFVGCPTRETALECAGCPRTILPGLLSTTTKQSHAY